MFQFFLLLDDQVIGCVRIWQGGDIFFEVFFDEAFINFSLSFLGDLFFASGCRFRWAFFFLTIYLNETFSTISSFSFFF
jgi:hypothetical protein